MKKVLALVLAVAMLATVAFAAGIGDSTIAPGKTITVTYEDFASKEGDLITIPNKNYFTSEYFTLAKPVIKKGANLITSVKFNDDKGVIEIKTAKDMLKELDTDKLANIYIEKISVRCKKDVKVKGETVLKRGTKEYFTNEVEMWYGNTPVAIPLDSDEVSYELDALNKFKEASEVYATATASYGDVTVYGRVYKDNKVYVDINNDPDVDVIKKYEDNELEFVNVETSGFPGKHTIEIAVPEEYYIYKIDDKGNAVASGLKWDEDAWAYVGSIRSSTTYILSEEKIATSSTSDTSNPETGAADVAGVVAAIAVVSVVAAGAVSMKK